eukprot:1669939-Pyramimonas_sp.AAC.1
MGARMGQFPRVHPHDQFPVRVRFGSTASGSAWFRFASGFRRVPVPSVLLQSVRFCGSRFGSV